MDTHIDTRSLPALSRTILTTFALVAEHSLKAQLSIYDLVVLTGWSIRTLRCHLPKLVEIGALSVDDTGSEHRYRLGLDIWFDPESRTLCAKKVERSTSSTKWLSELALETS
jgi:hypothetical protein